MADGTVQYRFQASIEQAERNFAKLEKKLDDQERKLKNVSRTSRRGAQQGNADFKSMTRNAASFAAGIGLVTSASSLASAAINRIKAEFTDLVETQRQAAQAQQTFAQAFDAAVLNLGGDATAKDLEDLIGRITGQTGGDRRQVAIALADALSARGNLGIGEVEEAVKATFQLAKNVQDVQAPLAGAILDFQKLQLWVAFN